MVAYIYKESSWASLPSSQKKKVVLRSFCSGQKGRNCSHAGYGETMGILFYYNYISGLQEYLLLLPPGVLLAAAFKRLLCYSHHSTPVLSFLAALCA